MKILSVLLLTIAAASTAWGATWRVEKDGSGDFAVIQQAIDASASGDTILVGPGRFEDFAPHVTPYTTQDCIAYVDQKDLSFVGSGVGTTTIGPTVEMNDVLQYPAGIVCLDQVSRVYVAHISFEHLYSGISLGALEAVIEHCRFSDAIAPASAMGVTDECIASIRDCVFQSIHKGVQFFTDLEGTEVIRCEFRDVFIAIQADGASGIMVSSCTVSDSEIGVGLFSGSSMTIADTRFEQMTGLGVKLNSFSTCSISAVSIESSGPYGIILTVHSTLTGTDNIVRGGVYGALYCYTSDVYMHDSHIIADGGPAVTCAHYPDHLPQNTIDLTNNWWGVADADSIAALIHDGNDDPGINVIVQYDPFAEGSVSNEDMTWSDLKNLYR